MWWWPPRTFTKAPTPWGSGVRRAAQSGINEDYNSFVVDRDCRSRQGRDQAALEPATPILAAVQSPELDTFIDDTARRWCTMRT